MPGREIEKRIPQVDGPQSDAGKLDLIFQALFVGDGKVGGSPGMMSALDEVRRDLADVKGELASQQARRINWWSGLGLAAAGGGIGQLLAAVWASVKAAPPTPPGH